MLSHWIPFWWLPSLFSGDKCGQATGAALLVLLGSAMIVPLCAGVNGDRKHVDLGMVIVYAAFVAWPFKTMVVAVALFFGWAVMAFIDSSKGG